MEENLGGTTKKRAKLAFRVDRTTIASSGREGNEGEDSVVLSECASKSPMATPGDIRKGGATKETPGVQDGSRRLKLTDRWERDRLDATVRLIRRSASAP